MYSHFFQVIQDEWELYLKIIQINFMAINEA